MTISPPNKLAVRFITKIEGLGAKTKYLPRPVPVITKPRRWHQ